jgi:hypothetical protein
MILADNLTFAEEMFLVGQRSAINQPFAQINHGLQNRGLVGHAFPEFSTFSEYFRNNAPTTPNFAETTKGIISGRGNIALTTNTHGEHFHLGEGDPGYAFLNGTINELILLPIAATEAQRIRITTYLTKKHNIQL